MTWDAAPPGLHLLFLDAALPFTSFLLKVETLGFQECIPLVFFKSDSP